MFCARTWFGDCCLGIVLFVLVWLLVGLFQLLKFAVFGLCLVLLIDWFGL